MAGKLAGRSGGGKVAATIGVATWRVSGRNCFSYVHSDVIVCRRIILRFVERRTYQIRAYTYVRIHVCTVHKRGHRSRFCLLRRSNVALTNCSRTVPRDMNFLATPWLHLPFSSFLSLLTFRYLSSSPAISSRVGYTPPGQVSFMLGGSTQWVDTGNRSVLVGKNLKPNFS